MVKLEWFKGDSSLCRVQWFWCVVCVVLVCVVLVCVVVDAALHQPYASMRIGDGTA